MAPCVRVCVCVLGDTPQRCTSEGASWETCPQLRTKLQQMSPCEGCSPSGLLSHSYRAAALTSVKKQSARCARLSSLSAHHAGVTCVLRRCLGGVGAVAGRDPGRSPAGGQTGRNTLHKGDMTAPTHYGRIKAGDCGKCYLHF